MFAFFIGLSQAAVPVFVILTMLNVGLTQQLSKIIAYWGEWRFVLKMLLANFVLAPLLMVVMLRLANFELPIAAGLLLFSMCAGAPFLIKLTQKSEQDLALGAATMLLLVLGTVVYLPLALPLALEGIAVDAWGIAKSLSLQLVLPIAVGMLLAASLPRVAIATQPWIAKIGNIALYVVLVATIVGYFPNILDIFGTGAIIVIAAFVLGAFGIGYLMGRGKDHLEDVGGLGTAQRNTAAGLIIAAQNFEHPDVLVIIVLANIIGLLLLLPLAGRLSRDNRQVAAEAFLEDKGLHWVNRARNDGGDG